MNPIRLLNEVFRKKDLTPHYNLLIRLTLHPPADASTHEVKELRELFRSHWAHELHVTRDGTLLPTYQPNIFLRCGFIAFSAPDAQREITIFQEAKKRGAFLHPSHVPHHRIHLDSNGEGKEEIYALGTAEGIPYLAYPSEHLQAFKRVTFSYPA